MQGFTIEELFIGQCASFAKTITEYDIYAFAGITGDMNPAHINEEYARETQFHGRIAHGMLTAGLISAVIGMQLPGPGSIYIKQELFFLSPVHIGDTVTSQVSVQSLEREKNRVILSTVCTNQDGVCVANGTAYIMPRVRS